MQPQMDLLHPLTSLEWSARSECCEMPVSVYNAQAVVLGNEIYIGGGSIDSGSSSKLLVYNFTKNSWLILDTPTQFYALTTYHSQLVLVGGADPDTLEATNQLWVLGEQCHWTNLPPMTTQRYLASAVSVGDCLIVAGGCDGDSLDAVEVYNGHWWRSAQSLPRACFCMKSTLHEGNWYLTGGIGQEGKVYYTSLESLIATTYLEGARQTSVWKQLPGRSRRWSTPAVLHNQLITVQGRYSSAIHAYSSSTESWVHVGDLPDVCNSSYSLVLPTGELLVLGDTKSGSSSHLFSAKIEGI